MNGAEAAKGGFHLYVKLKNKNEIEKQEHTSLHPRKWGVPEHHSHPVCHKAHFRPTLFLIPRNLQNKSLYLQIPFNPIFQLASGSVATLSTAPTLTWSLLAAL